ncbi:Phosphotyrosyl phosphatase activator [Hesseltinella vesiculosa]|uniref:Serine/threonine-protein phosphatase 2A activator n=1 Tax=Hesseltinella vesiculosa TaxID=101127 RepID=A0A1X2G7A7_9FUNG|nr:Phosphotyrosyl phosphatase activator [Hesseltinella vesiculosa]
MQAQDVPYPSLRSNYTPTAPRKCIREQKDIETFVRSPAYERIMTFILMLNQSVMDKPLSAVRSISFNVQAVVSLLDIIDGYIIDFPPLNNPQRFGNKAFRMWLHHVEERTPSIMQSTLPESLHPALPELNVYWLGSFGNETRIDYGSGHELSFLAWLAGLAMLDYFSKDEFDAVVLRIFTRYLELVRRLQQTYSLEPAGSHGVWGLDDHQFLPYLWGSAQLVHHPKLKPSSIVQKDVIEAMAPDYMYFRCIQYIGEMKRGPFHEHSPMLFDISGVVSWNKVNTGMSKMYIAEVLTKVPVVQHFLFGFLFPFSAYK